MATTKEKITMKTQKFRVFRAAAKRGISPAAVRRELCRRGLPPTLAEEPPRYGKEIFLSDGAGGGEGIPNSRR